jgi:hypothetical protein
LSSVTYYFDDDISSKRVVRGLIGAEIQVLTADAAGMRGRADGEHLAFAADAGRVLCTANQADFMRLHWQYIELDNHHAGIVIITQQAYSIGEQIERLVRLARLVTAEQMRDRIEFIARWGE